MRKLSSCDQVGCDYFRSSKKIHTFKLGGSFPHFISCTKLLLLFRADFLIDKLKIRTTNTDTKNNNKPTRELM